MTDNHRPLNEIFLAEGTVCYPVDRAQQQVLLGMKKRGIGVGLYNGFGGKIEVDETPVAAAARELWEESGLTVSVASLQLMGHIYFPHVQLRMHVFVATAWDGLFAESDEMRPQWFSMIDLPYDQMWSTDRDWLPYVLVGRRVAVVVHKDADGRRSSVIQLVD